MANLTMKILQDQINELRNEVSILKSEKSVSKIPSGLKIGDTFKIAGLDWKIIDITDKGYSCLCEILEKEMKFDDSSNDWKSSGLRKYLNGDFFKKISDEVGEENIAKFERNLLSLDGQTEYEKCEDSVSLLTVDEYRKYRRLIPNDEKWWWLITPWSTPCNDYEYAVAVVASSGDFVLRICRDDGGVRPFCIFSSSIFES
uniref:Uncharacterized protein n=1 Tax=virus sp. ctQmo6 TaxID=2827990 RepID=A0A8S5RGC3_9VIRU|nr:MAG TPA: hypothetical protein [virus sp. ctQmo6]